MALPTSDSPVEAILPDGGHVIVSFADSATRVKAGDGVVAALLHAGGSEHDVERAVADEMNELGFDCTPSATHGPTVIVIGRR